MKWNLIFKIGLLLVLITVNNVNASECSSIEECIALIPATEGKSYGSSGEVDDSVRRRLQSFGRDALIPLSKLTNESNHNRRAVADYLISRIKELNEDDFVTIHKVIENNIKFDGGNWSYGALGYVGGEAAGKYLISELKKVQSGGNQIGTAFSRLGLKGLPFLIEGLRCFNSCKVDELRGFVQVFSNFQYGEKISDDESARELFSIAKNQRIDMHARQIAMGVIGYITYNPQLAHKINNYAESYPDFSDAALSSLNNMKSPLAARILVDRLSFDRDESVFSNPREYSPLDHNRSIFYDLSKIGSKASNLGSEIMPYLKSTLWEDQIYSAITLGYVGYSQAIPQLLKLLSNKEDWQQTYAAIKALHMLGNKETIPDIEIIAKSHWYTPLREYAKNIVVSMKTHEPSEKLHINKHRPHNFFDYEYLRQEDHRCDKSDYTEVLEPVEFKQYRKSSEKVNEFKYQNPQCRNEEYRKYYRDYCNNRRSLVFPDFIAKYDQRWLVGDDRGEWGGELMLFEKDKAPQPLLNENIENVYVIGEYAYVISGLAHLSSNSGLIFRVEKVESGYSIQPFYRLPGAPRISWKINGDSLLINTESGAVIFNPHNGLKMASCSDK